MAADFLDRPRFSRGFLTGAALGTLGLIRVFDPLLFGLPFLVAFVWRARRRHYVTAPSIIIGGLPFLAALLLFYGITTGLPLPDLTKSGGSLVKFGLFPVDEDGHSYTPLDQLRLAARFIGELAVFTSPLRRRFRVESRPPEAQFLRFHFSGYGGRFPARPVERRQPVRPALLFRGLSVPRADDRLGARAIAAKRGTA
jgi:hypothetical protein